MPIACLIMHDPEPATALFLDNTAFASCRRCGAGLIDHGDGWKTPLPWTDVLFRKPPPARVPVRVTAGSAYRHVG